MIGLQCGTGSLLSGENGGSLWQDELDTLKGKVEPNRGGGGGGEKKKEEKKTGGRMHKLARRGARRGRLTKQHPHTSPAALSVSAVSPSALGGCLLAVWVASWIQRRCQRTPRRNRYLCLLSGHEELSQPCLQGLGGAPWPIILSSPFCLSHKEIYTSEVLSARLVLRTHQLHTSPIVPEFMDTVWKVCSEICSCRHVNKGGNCFFLGLQLTVLLTTDLSIIFSVNGPNGNSSNRLSN